MDSDKRGKHGSKVGDKNPKENIQTRYGKSIRKTKEFYRLQKQHGIIYGPKWQGKMVRSPTKAGRKENT